MTIKIEQEAMIRVLDTAICSLPCHPTPPLKPPSTGGVGATEGGPSSLPSPYVAVVQKPTDDCFCPDLQSLDSDEDCISLSSYGSASSFGGESTERRVSFAEQLVSEVKTRPRTKECDKRLLFYTQSETDRFRQLYREERQSMSVTVQSDAADREPPSAEGGRRRISRVVVQHEDSQETFYDLHDFSSYTPQKGGASSMNDDFFDNDSFWSGSITWY